MFAGICGILVETGFLEQFEFKKLDGDSDFLVTIYPGPRAKKWYLKTKKNYKRLPHDCMDRETETCDLLIKKGIARTTAIELAGKYSLDEIRQQLEWLPFRNPDNPPAVLVKSIRERWSPPASCIQIQRETEYALNEKKHKDRKAKQEQIKQEKKEAETKELEKFYKNLDTRQRKEVDTWAQDMLPDFLKEKQSEARSRGEEYFAVKTSLKAKRNIVLKEMLNAKDENGHISG